MAKKEFANPFTVTTLFRFKRGFKTGSQKISNKITAFK